MNPKTSIQQIAKHLKSNPDPLLKGILGAISGILFLVFAVRFSIEYATSQHWGLGLLVTAIVAAIGAYILLIARPKGLISGALTYFILSMAIGAVVCAGISYILHVRGWADYSVAQPATVETFFWFYVWTIVDIMPVLDVWKTLPVKSPVAVEDAIAGAPVLLFRIYIMIFVFASIRQWWRSRISTAPGRPPVTSSQSTW